MNKQILSISLSALAGASFWGANARAFAVDAKTQFNAVTQFSVSPATPAAGDWQASFGTPDGRAITAIVKAPNAAASAGGTYAVPPIAAGQNPWSYFQNAINRVRTVSPRPSLVVFPSGTYVIAPRDATGAAKTLHLDFSSLSDVTFDFSGANLIFAENAPAAGQAIKPVVGMYVANSQRIAIKNASINWSLPGGASLAALGTIRKTASGNALTIDASYPVTSPAQTIRVVSQYDSAANGWLQSPVAESYFNSNYPVQSATDPQTFSSPAFAAYPADSRVVVRYYRFEGHAVYVTGRNTDDISFENLTIYQAPGMGFAFYQPGRGARISGCKIMRNPNDPLQAITMSSDGAHFTNSLGDIIFENNDFSYQGDDGLNLTSTVNPVQTAPVVDASKNASVQVRYAGERYAAGDVIGFFNNDMSMIGSARLVSALISSDGASATLSFDSTSSSVMPYVTPWSGGSAPAFQSMVSDLTLSSNRYVVRGNDLHDNRARGALLQAGNGRVQNNRFRNQTLNSVYLAASAFWGEGPGANNVRFVNNSIANSGNVNVGSKPAMMGALIVNDAAQTGNSNAQVNQYLVISNNAFDNTPGPAMFIASSARLTVSNNAVTRANQKPVVTAYGTTNTSFPMVLTGGIYTSLLNNSFDSSSYPFGVDRNQIDALSVDVSEDAYLGDAQFSVYLDGGLVAGPLTAKALHSLGQSQDATFIGKWSGARHRVSVAFLNDAWGGTPDTDRNLYVNSVYFDGAHAQNDSAALYGQGSVEFYWP